MSSLRFTNLPSSDDEQETVHVSGHQKSFHLRMEESARLSDETNSDNYHTDSPLLKRKRPMFASESPLDLSRISSRNQHSSQDSGACGGPEDLSSTPLHRHRTSTPKLPTIRSSSTRADTQIENIKKLMDEHTRTVVKVQNSLLEQILQKLENGLLQHEKAGQKKIHVTAQVKQSIRDAFKHEKNNGLTWTCKTGDGVVLKHTSAPNKSMTEAVCLYVKGQFPSTEEGVIRSGIETHFNSFRQKEHMVAEGMMPAHKKKMAHYSRKTRKLANRQKALKDKKLPQEEENKIWESLKIDFMSSEESDSDDDSQLIIRPIPWLSEEYKHLLSKLDKKYIKSLSSQGRRLRSKRKVGRPTERPCPPRPDGHGWVFSQ